VQAKGIENIFNKIIGEISPNLEKGTVIHVQKAFRTPNRQDQKRTIPRHIIVKTLNIQIKKITLNATRENCQVTCKGKSI
jgi:hypothetical protein